MLGVFDALVARSDALCILPGARVLSEVALRDALLTDEFAEAREHGLTLDREEF
jgi:hypothetical protein